MTTRVTMVCKTCGYKARRNLLEVTACRGVHETPPEPATCPKGHGPMVRADQDTIDAYYKRMTGKRVIT